MILHNFPFISFEYYVFFHTPLKKYTPNDEQLGCGGRFERKSVVFTQGD